MARFKGKTEKIMEEKGLGQKIFKKSGMVLRLQEVSRKNFRIFPPWEVGVLKNPQSFGVFPFFFLKGVQGKIGDKGACRALSSLFQGLMTLEGTKGEGKIAQDSNPQEKNPFPQSFWGKGCLRAIKALRTHQCTQRGRIPLCAKNRMQLWGLVNHR